MFAVLQFVTLPPDAKDEQSQRKDGAENRDVIEGEMQVREVH
jgi:hypothetical protein